MSRKRKRKNGGLRYTKRGLTEKYYNTNINGDLMTRDVDYAKAMQFLVDWEPNEELRKFTDLYVPEYSLIIKKNSIEVKFNYPRNFEELCNFIFSKLDITNSFLREEIIKSKDLELLLNIMS